jgi:hypothetical protein
VARDADRRRPRPAQLVVALLLLLLFTSLDAPFPWSTPLYYELAFDVEPWHGDDGLQRARADLAREGLTPRSIELTWTLGNIACMATGCAVFKAIRATFDWTQVPYALERCFTYDSIRLARATAAGRTDCRPIFTTETRPRSG